MLNHQDGVQLTLQKLLKYCEAHDWAGYDPYDALNSLLLDFIPQKGGRFFRIALTQALKRLPVNLRPLLLVKKEQNPKALGLFLLAYLRLQRLGLPDQGNRVGLMVDRLVALRSKNTSYWCWGYSFPWQTRTVLVPQWAPNLVCTTFVACSLLSAYEASQEERCLSMAVSSAEYLLNELFWEEDNSTAGFSYPLPKLRARVHNANFLGAALLCRVYKQTGEKKFLEPALKIARYSASKQKDDGAWDYGELSTQRWVDNFHTGYNLCALRSICQSTETSEFESHIRLGFEFYRGHFFREDGATGYFHDRLYPIDIHSVAQSIITLVELKDLDKGNIELAHSIYQWAMNHMWDERGYFHYRVLPFFKNKISYMRWTQAWMVLALSTLLDSYGRSRTRIDG